MKILKNHEKIIDIHKSLYRNHGNFTKTWKIDKKHVKYTKIMENYNNY